MHAFSQGPQTVFIISEPVLRLTLQARELSEASLYRAEEDELINGELIGLPELREL